MMQTNINNHKVNKEKIKQRDLETDHLVNPKEFQIMEAKGI